MGLLEAGLAIVGLGTIIAVIVRWHLTDTKTPAEPDLAQPYREGLHAAARLQRAAQEAEARIYAESARQVSE
jgi:hypothetical protein